MDIILTINIVIAAIFTACYAYQLFFLLVPFTKKQEPHKPEVLHRFAILICARNEEAVIADLIQSIRNQTYDQSLMTVFVMADNCTDATAEIAGAKGPWSIPALTRKRWERDTPWNSCSFTLRRTIPRSLRAFSSSTRTTCWTAISWRK